MGELDGSLGLSERGGGKDALIEGHHDVASDRLLHLDAGFGREEIGLSIHVALKARALFVDFPRMRQRKNLIAAGVCQYGTIPVHETVDAAESFEDLGP